MNIIYKHRDAKQKGILSICFKIEQGWRNQLSVLSICCSGQETFSS